MTFLTISKNIEHGKAIGEFRGLILATTVQFEVLAGFLFAICIFCADMLSAVAGLPSPLLG